MKLMNEEAFGLAYAKAISQNMTALMRLDMVVKPHVKPPGADLGAMRNAGIKLPCPLKYWAAYNEYMLQTRL
jgi:hypothetical protein